MPFFSYPANADWLLPLVKVPLTLMSLVFDAIRVMGPIGNVLCAAIIIGLFANNLMKPIKS
jgi:hypothetical protein